MDRIREKEELLYKLGSLFGPVEALVALPFHSEELRARVMARYTSEHKKLIREFQAFSIGEPGHDYATQYNAFHNALYGLPQQVATSPEKLADFVQSALQSARTALRSIPVDVESQIFLSQTPFTTYCTLKAITGSANSRIVFVDRFLHTSVFYRYLSALQPNVNTTLVGPKRSMTDEFLDVSHVFAREVGPDLYSLVSVPYHDIHDRWFRGDDTLLHFGNSNAHAAMINDFTITRIDNTPENIAAIDTAIASGVQQFGPAQKTHPSTSADLI